MWAVIPAPMPVEFLRRRSGFISVNYSKPPPRSYERILHISGKSKESESEPVIGLGGEMIIRSGESMREEKKMSGSDVILALQRAAAERKRTNADKKTMKKKKKTGVVEVLLSSTGESTEDNGVDYNNVRPLSIKSEWGRKLDEFEKLLKDFEQMGL